jgi:hypothetical protein
MLNIEQQEGRYDAICLMSTELKSMMREHQVADQDRDSSSSYVYLHNNHIATVTDNDVTIYDGGWQTVTTKSRLNAICSRFCIAGEGVCQRKGEWYIHKLAGMAGTTKFLSPTVTSLHD